MNFYVIGKEITQTASPDDQYEPAWCEAWAVERKNGTYEKCPMCGRPVSMLKWEKPRNVRLSNTKYPDRLSNWLLEPLVVSEHFVNAYFESKLTGITSFSSVEVVEVAQKSTSSPIPPHYFIGETSFSSTVQVDVKHSKVYGQQRDWSCPLCNPFGITCDKIERLVLNTDQWDGTDVFRVYAAGTICSQRFYDFVKSYGFTNFNLEPIETYQWP